ncbi:MAG TPA: MmcQ/YjbR family DNA-binding protein [Rhizomicrobium sp.]|jgi:predicted DNA-binding protein (MmcQ/YjbR family)
MAGKAFEHVRRYALTFPETREDHPWGESAIKVRGKTFVFLGGDKGTLHLSVKLPQSKEFALEYPFTKPTAYGLGKSGWVSASFGAKDKPPLDVLEAWIAESYRAIAPKSLHGAAADRFAPPVKKAARKRGSPASDD